jgi:glutamine--fructose-6-phosphate transaminase
VPESSVVREADLKLMTRAGPEIGVASTKAFTTQLAALALLSLQLAKLRGLDEARYLDLCSQLQALPRAIEQALKLEPEIVELAEHFIPRHHALFLGRGAHYPVALEAALKLKELAYMHAEGFAAGELKHGPIALIEEGLPVIVVMPSPKNAAVLHAKLLSNIREIQTRGAVTIVITEEGDDTVRPYADYLIEIPSVPTLYQPLLSTIPLQVFAAGVAQARGYDVDKPRNLAKSVTVE